jgi:hypothetical protein
LCQISAPNQLCILKTLADKLNNILGLSKNTPFSKETIYNHQYYFKTVAMVKGMTKVLVTPL